MAIEILRTGKSIPCLENICTSAEAVLAVFGDCADKTEDVVEVARRVLDTLKLLHNMQTTLSKLAGEQRAELEQAMQDVNNLIEEVKKDNITFPSSPTKYEAGTLQTAEVVGFSESIKFIEDVGIKNIMKHENSKKLSIHT